MKFRDTITVNDPVNAFRVLTSRDGASSFRDIGKYTEYSESFGRIRVAYPTTFGTARVTLKPWPVDGYAPATLSPLGQKLLGISSEEYAEAHGRKRKRAGSAVIVID